MNIVTINNCSAKLSDTQLERLGAVLVAPNRQWASAASRVGIRSYDILVDGDLGSGIPGLLKTFNCHDFIMIRNAMLLEDPVFRAEIKEYGLTIMCPEPKGLTETEEIISEWLFSSKIAQGIANTLSGKLRTVNWHIENIADKILADGIEKSRFNICAALLNLGYPKGIGEADATNFTDYEEILQDRYL